VVRPSQLRCRRSNTGWAVPEAVEGCSATAPGGAANPTVAPLPRGTGGTAQAGMQAWRPCSPAKRHDFRSSLERKSGTIGTERRHSDGRPRRLSSLVARVRMSRNTAGARPHRHSLPDRARLARSVQQRHRRLASLSTLTDSPALPHRDRSSNQVSWRPSRSGPSSPHCQRNPGPVTAHWPDGPHVSLSRQQNRDLSGLAPLTG